MCKKLADKHPEHKWIATKAGFELLQKWMEEQEKRDQDNFGMYIYNDFSGYGTMEVMDNMVSLVPIMIPEERVESTQSIVAVLRQRI